MQADISFSLTNRRRHFIHTLHFADDAKGLRIDESIDELAAFHSAVLIQHDHRHVFHVVVERVAEGDHFDERREKHEKQSQRIAQHHEEFLVKNGVEAAKGSGHGPPPLIPRL